MPRNLCASIAGSVPQLYGHCIVSVYLCEKCVNPCASWRGNHLATHFFAKGTVNDVSNLYLTWMRSEIRKDRIPDEFLVLFTNTAQKLEELGVPVTELGLQVLFL